MWEEEKGGRGRRRKDLKAKEKEKEEEQLEGILIDYFARTRGGGGVYPSEILENFLFLGGVKSSEDREVLRHLGWCVCVLVMVVVVSHCLF